MQADTTVARGLHAYAVPREHFDELRTGDGSLYSHWREFIARAGGFDPLELDRKQAALARQIEANGITYNVCATPDVPSRSWGLDALPMLVTAEQWAPLAAGMKQRARLLNALAADIYGRQRTLSEGLLPQALVYGHPGFERACHGVRVPADVFVYQAAFDVARGGDGRWWVIRGRAQAPSGTGYALENRLAISRLYPAAFRDMQVQRLAPFFRTLQRTLTEAAPCAGAAPRIVLLSPGPYSETYFEHAYLARYLGLTLVEGADLTVREERVFLKTLAGLERVHVILRRLDDDYCDPLELRPESALGVAGLLQAWRAGHVVVANAFGTSVLESPALDGFLPSLCEHLLGERLALPSVATWWCGEAAALADALPLLSRLVLKPAFPDMGLEPVFLAELDTAARARWVDRIHASPQRYVLQEYLPLPHAPVWHQGRLESRALMLRIFLVADGRGDYVVMPGGLSRIAGSERAIVSGQRGGSSKDTWVLADAPVAADTLLRAALHAGDIHRSRRSISSRAGENLFWLGRYAERAENGARLLRAVLRRLVDRDPFGAAEERLVVSVCQHHGLLPYTFEGALPGPVLEHELIGAMFDRRTASSLASTVRQIAGVAGAVRDCLSADSWRLVNEMSRPFVPAGSEAVGLSDALERADRTIVWLVALGGMETSHMSRDDGWRMLSIGRAIERLIFLSSIVADGIDGADTGQPALLEWLLDLTDGTIAYRARYHSAPEWLAVAELLLFDRRSPRSAVYQLAKLVKQMRLLPQADLGAVAAEVLQAYAMCRAAMTPGSPLAAGGPALIEFLRHCRDLAGRLSDALARAYFSHVPSASLESA